MGSYHLLKDTDILHSTVHTAPRIIMASGTAGWRGNVGVSSSLSLYGGIRGRTDVKSSDFVRSGISIYPLDPLDTHSIDKVIFVSGSYPATGSIRFVKVRNSSLSGVFGGLTNVTADDWYDEHFSPIDILYDFHSRYNPDFFLGSYDFQSLYLKQNTVNLAPCVHFSGSSLSIISSSLTLELRIKPTLITGTTDFTLQSQASRWRFFITGSSGRLAWSDYRTTLSSSFTLTPSVWQHVAFVISNQTGSFYVDGSLRDSSPFTGTLSYTGSPVSSSLVVGARQYLSGSTLVFDQGFRGFLYESRVWSRAQTSAQISSSFLKTLPDYSSTGLVHYARFNDGPLATRHGYNVGSGSFDYSPSSVHGTFINMGSTLPVSPIWQMNDDRRFITTKVQASGTLKMLRVLHIPSMFYGRQIATGSVRLTCNSYSNQGIIRQVVDDHRGGLYISGSLTKTLSGEDYRGVAWNKVGNVFYGEGLIVLTDPSLLDFGEINRDSSLQDTLQVEFAGVNRIPTKVFMCRLEAAEANASNNPTFKKIDPTDTIGTRIVISRSEPVTYVTGIGIYDADRNLVAVAKLAQPIRKREKDKLNIKVRMDL